MAKLSLIIFTAVLSGVLANPPSYRNNYYPAAGPSASIGGAIVSSGGLSKGSGDVIYPAPGQPCPEGNEKGELIIHRPAPIVVKRPATKITVNHPPVVVRPAPVIFRKPASKIVTTQVLQNVPQRVQIEPVYLQVSGPTSRQVFVQPEPVQSQADCGGYFGNGQGLALTGSAYGSLGSFGSADLIGSTGTVGAIGSAGSYAGAGYLNGANYYSNGIASSQLPC